MTDSNQKLECIITESPPMLVVSFFGAIADTTSKEIKKCQAVILSKSLEIAVVLSFHGAPTVETSGIEHLVQLQKAIRHNQMKLFLCALSPEIRQSLLGQGAIRERELARDLVEATRLIIGE